MSNSLYLKFLCLACFPAIAFASPASDFAQWKYLRDPGTAQISFNEGHRFLQQHGDWPEAKVIQLRTEGAALLERPEGGTMERFCTAFPPISGRGMFACALADVGNEQQQHDWVEKGWRQGDFSPYEEALILSSFGDRLREADHIARMDRLLFEGKTASAKRMLPYVPRERHTLYMARMALQLSAKDVEHRINTVPVNLKRDPGLLLDRIRWRQRKGMDEGMIELFLVAPKNPPYADLWWPARHIAVREAIGRGQYQRARNILDHHGALKPEFLAEALALKGWISLRFLNQAGTAYEDFYKLYTSVQTPVSKSRAAYWAARAAEANGNTSIARDWYEKAADHPTVFYGQLAHEKINPGEPLDLPNQPTFSSGAKAGFEREPMVQVYRMLVAQGDKETADSFILHMATMAEEPERFAMLTSLARETGQQFDAVRVAKLALRKGVVMIDAGWPQIPTPQGAAIEPALTLAITRQESEFDTRANSRADARGLMQLLPGTGKMTAKRIGLPYGTETLWRPETNLLLGSAYLGQLIEGFGGSYILAIAGYNAGPRNARNWSEEYGRPGGNAETSIDWIESIPFGETRNYVQRVLENLQVYRQLLGQAKAPQLSKDLER